ncbi:unnamed protein product [Camellia sinensis]
MCAPSTRKESVLMEADTDMNMNWHSSSPTSGMDVNSMLRACPICRKVSYFVIPSVIWYSTKEENQEIVDSYKAKLRIGEVGRAEEFFREMGLSDWGCKALEFLRVAMRKHEITSKRKSYEFLIKRLCQEGRAEEALKLQAEMEGKGFEPNLEIYSAFIDANAKQGNDELAGMLKKEMLETQMPKKQEAGNTSFLTYSLLYGENYFGSRRNYLKLDFAPSCREAQTWSIYTGVDFYKKLCGVSIIRRN